jgi:DNA replication protein DnaC
VPATQAGSELLFDTTSMAYEKTSLVVTRNLPFERWTEVPGGERLVAATLDRLTHRCQVLEANGEGFRLMEARRRRAARNPAASVAQSEPPSARGPPG